MAWTGTATVAKISDRLVRITGLSLAGAASGTIGIGHSSSEVDILNLPDWEAYGDVTLQDAVSVLINVLTDVTSPVPISVVKTGTNQTDFVLTFHNDTAATASGSLEIYLEFH